MSDSRQLATEQMQQCDDASSSIIDIERRSFWKNGSMLPCAGATTNRCDIAACPTVLHATNGKTDLQRRLLNHKSVSHISDLASRRAHQLVEGFREAFLEM